MKKFVALLLVSFSLVGCGSNSDYYNENATTEVTTENVLEDTTESNESDKSEITEITEIIDAKKFANITEDELIEIMGEPNNIEEWNYTTSRATFPVKTYSYDKDYHYEFLVNKKVVRLNCYSMKYWTGSGEDMKYSTQNGIPLMFGVDEKVSNPLNTGYALRWSDLMGDIKDIWVIDIDDLNRSMGGVKVTYNKNFLD